MKKTKYNILFIICMLLLGGCGGNVSNVQIKDFTSQIYTDDEIERAIAVVFDYFKNEFDGCRLREIAYIGDDKVADWQEYAKRNDADDVIVFTSSFTTGSKCGDGSLNPNDTYTKWKWILVRNHNGKWKHVDHGY